MSLSKHKPQPYYSPDGQLTVYKPVQNLDYGPWTGPWTGLWTGPWTGLWTEIANAHTPSLGPESSWFIFSQGDFRSVVSRRWIQGR